MDAKKTLALLGGALVMMTGCFPLRDSPTAHPENPEPTDPLPPSEVVQAGPAESAELAADTSADDVDILVQGYIANVDGIATRLQRNPGQANPGRLVSAIETTTQPPQSLNDFPGDGDEPTAEPLTGAALPWQTPGAPSMAFQRPKSPVLGGLTVHAAPAELATDTGDATAAAVNGTATAHNAPVSLRDMLDHWPGDPEASTFRRQLDRRMIAVLAGDYAEARRPLTMVSDAQQDIAARFVESLIVIRDEHDGDPAGASTRVMEELAELSEALRSLSDLRIPTLAICQEVSGYGIYKPIEPAVFPGGVPSEFVTYCEVSDFVRQRGEDGLYVSRFDMRTRVLDSLGETVLDVRDRDIVDRCRQPRHDCFIPRLIRVPGTLAPGEYVVKVTIVDKLGEKVTENRASFRVLAGP
ncbi:MAG: hypothetical protein PVJ57_10925 [Phycisphaerae bacterium]|jgi:hypothetical protein